MTALSKISSLQGLPKTPADSSLVRAVEVKITDWLVKLQAEHPDRCSTIAPVETLVFKQKKKGKKNKKVKPVRLPDSNYSAETVSWARSIGIDPICLIEQIHAWREILVANSATLLPGRTNVSLREDAVRSAWKQAISNLQLPLEWRNPKLHPQKNGRRFD